MLFVYEEYIIPMPNLLGDSGDPMRPNMLDTLIADGWVADGSGNPIYRADVTVFDFSGLQGLSTTEQPLAYTRG